MTRLTPKQQLRISGYELDMRSTSQYEEGSPVVVLVHGIGVSGDYFFPFANELARTCRVYVLDLPGYGTTPKPKDALNIEELGAVVASFIEIQQIKGVTLIGHSMGCQVALQVAQRHPAHVAKLILLAPTINSKERRVMWQLWRLVQDSTIEPIRVTGRMIYDYTRFGVRRYLHTLRHMLVDAPEARFADCKQSTIVMRGERDVIVPESWARHVARSLPDASYLELPGQPHAAHYSAPALTAAACIRFINRK